jgi:VIT1/CCC1 family predicted Fe2+/Mn2+ transporter
MAAGEYVSVSTQKDSELALLEKERRELLEEPQEELEELAGIYVGKGLTEELALEVAKQLTEHDALGAHAEAELGIDPDDITSPWNAALASMVAFTIGALLPLLTITLFGPTTRIWVTVVSVTLALALTGWGSARFGYGPARRAVLRNMAGGLFAMAVTYAIGSALGTHV